MIEALINKVRSYQGEKGTEFDPQIILFKLSGCSKCKELEAELMIDGWSYEAFDCNQNEHSNIADKIESTLKTDAYPIVFTLYPESKIIVNTSGVIDKSVIILNSNISFYKQLTVHL
jgi:hypothetical protein